MNKVKLSVTFLVVALAIGILSCTKTVGPLKKDEPVPVEFCDSISYKEDIVPIITRSCIKSGCHDAATKAGGVEYTAMLKEKADAGRIKARVIDGTGGFMPADVGKLPENELKIIQCWLDKGAPNN